jgi:hypothetical protein
VVELVVVSALLTVLGVAVFSRHVVQGGFYSDDWSNLALYEFADSPRYVNAVDVTAAELGSRPLLAALLPLPHALFGADMAAQLALALGLGVLTCVLFYLFLRAIPVAPLHAGAIAALALIFPWADSIRLWATASVNTVALCFAFLGGYLALRGLESEGRRRTTALVVAAVLYGLSVLTYEVAGVALLLLGVLYLQRAPRVTALRWWAIHGAVVVAALAYTAATTDKEVGGIGQRLDDLPSYTRHAVAIFSFSFVPPGTTNGLLRAGAVALVVGIVGFGAWRWRTTREPRLGFWLAFVAGSVVAVVSAYVITLGASLDPIKGGTFNRGNIFAAFGMVAALYGAAMVLACLLQGQRRLAVAVAAASVLLVGAGYTARVSNDIDAWVRAARLQEPVIENAERAARDALPGSTLLTFGHNGQVDGGIPIFEVMWDLDGAMRVRTDGRVRHAYPVHDRVRLRCGPRVMTIDYLEIGYAVSASYRKTYFVDAATGRHERVASQADCLSARRRFRPGSWVAPAGA